MNKTLVIATGIIVVLVLATVFFQGNIAGEAFGKLKYKKILQEGRSDCNCNSNSDCNSWEYCDLTGNSPCTLFQGSQETGLCVSCDACSEDPQGCLEPTFPLSLTDSNNNAVRCVKLPGTRYPINVIFSNNDLVGTIPWNQLLELEDIQGISTIQLNGNELKGSIPNNIGEFINLWNLILSDNDLEGGIPESIGNLVELRDFRVNSNQLTGQIPSAVLDGSLSNIRNIWLQNNEFTGEVPNVIPGYLNQLSVLNLKNNKLRGILPSGLCLLKDYYQTFIELKNNKLCPVHYQPECFQESNKWPLGIGSQNPDINDPDCPGIGVCAWNDQWGVHNGPVINCDSDFSTQGWVSARAVCNKQVGGATVPINVYMCGNIYTTEDNTNNCDSPEEWDYLTGHEACNSQGMTCQGVQILPGGC